MDINQSYEIISDLCSNCKRSCKNIKTVGCSSFKPNDNYKLLTELYKNLDNSINYNEDITTL